MDLVDLTTLPSNAFYLNLFPIFSLYWGPIPTVYLPCGKLLTVTEPNQSKTNM